MFASKPHGFLSAMTMVTAAGVLRVHSPFSAIPLPSFEVGARLRVPPLPTSLVNTRLMNGNFAGVETQALATLEQKQTAINRDRVYGMRFL